MQAYVHHFKYAERIKLPFNSNITSSCTFNDVALIGGAFVTRTTAALSSNLWFNRSNIQS